CPAAVGHQHRPLGRTLLRRTPTMLITDDQRTALQTLIELTAHGRALRHEHDNPKRAGELAELVRTHQELGQERAKKSESGDGHRAPTAETSAPIEAPRPQIAKKTAELSDGWGLTSRHLANLQSAIAGHEGRASELAEAGLEQMETLETAEADLS